MIMVLSCSLLMAAVWLGCSKSNVKSKTNTLSAALRSDEITVGTANDTNDVRFTFDTVVLKDRLQAQSVFDSIQQIKLDYHYVDSGYKSYLTIYGYDSGHVMAVQYSLDIAGTDLIMVNPSTSNRQLATVHSCVGDGCSYCDFVVTWYGAIHGCTCLGIYRPGGGCNHTISTALIQPAYDAILNMM